MNTFKKKSLHAAVLAGLGALTAAGTADAVHINPDGVGQVLIFPYYTARAGNFTALSIINTTSQTKAVKVRFLEGKASREVLDFNLWMSPQDVFTGAVVATANGARLISNDNSCVTPSDLFQEIRTDAGSTVVLPGQPVSQGAGLPLNEFKNYQYAAYDNNGSTLDRTREGYFEVIEMGIVTSAVITGFAKHAGSVPANCVAIDNFDALFPGAAPVQGFFSNTNLLGNPTGGLAGRASVINSTNGSNYTFAPTAVDAWRVASVLQPNVVDYSASGLTTPDLGDVTPTTSNVFAYNSATGVAGLATATWGTGRDAMSAILMRDTVMNEFILDNGTRSATDWVVTFPTKRLHVTPTSATAPFTNNYNSANAGCEPYTLAIYNREESTLGGAAGVLLPSPRPAVITVGSTICWEATIVPFGAASLLGSTNISGLVGGVQQFAQNATSTTGPKVTPSLAGTQGPNGWFLMSFNGAAQRITPVAATFAGAAVPGVHIGMPVVGAMLNNYTNTATAGSLYGSVIGHRYTRNIQ